MNQSDEVLTEVRQELEQLRSPLTAIAGISDLMRTKSLTDQSKWSKELEVITFKLIGKVNGMCQRIDQHIGISNR